MRSNLALDSLSVRMRPVSGCVRYLASPVTAFVQPRWRAVAGLATSR